MNPLNYILARFYEVRSRKAFRAYVALKAKAEKYFKKAGL